MAPQGSGGQGAKEILDKLGEQIQKEVHTKALEYENDLHGFLSRVEFKKGENNKITNPCDLNHEYQTTVTTGHSYPCENRLNVRFSDVISGQCTNKKIKGNEGKEGACAPLRRLHLCDRNLEEIKYNKINQTDNLLVDVLLAAKYEGESIRNAYSQKSNDYKSGLCTALARSFADIGDIIRGKDLFLGGPDQEKKKLEENLRNIFKNIHDHLTDAKAKSYYKNDNDRNYFKLRNDWWELNRQQVWNAITCGAPSDAQYFRNTCSSIKGGHYKNCHCIGGDVLTNFDYVPQYLRWFDEWTEEFCRKKKKYVDIVKKYCRDESEGKYCSLNGHDCTETIRKIGLLRMGNGCTNCLHACTHYRGWLAKQQEEFEKQKKKYTKEINGSNPPKNDISNTANNEHDRKFYGKLKTEYGNVHTFLKLLNEEKECKVITTGEGQINFPINDYKETFYRSEYCEMCPECGVICANRKCEKRLQSDKKCKKEERDRKKKPQITDIEFLFNNKEGDDIVKKLNAFYYPTGPHNKDKGIEEWKCSYYDDEDNDCETKNYGKDVEGDSKIMPFVDFFELWVTHLLQDSIEWRKEISKCLNNNSLTKCSNRCNRYCRFFKKWVEQKKKEWTQIKNHFEKQEGLPKNQHFTILETLLEEEFFDQIKEAYGDVKSIEKIKVLLSKRRIKKDDELQNKEDIIEKLLEHELEDYEKCKETHNDDRCSQDTQGGRSGGTHDHEDDSDDEEPPTPLVDNACSGDPSGGSSIHRSIVNRVAHHFREVAHNKMKENIKSNSVKGSKHNVLEADATKGIYKSSGNSVPLTDICTINENHSNRNPKNSSGPCQGKDQGRFKIGKDWTNVNEKQKTTYKDVIMPQRREHMCTSNLEYLETKCRPLDGKGDDCDKVNHSFLGDVLLSAKKEGDFIVEKLRSDKSAICNAMKYSFADIGDIIRGRDMWDLNDGSQKMETILKNIFGTLHRSLDGIKGNDKYTQDENKTPKYKQLREDWWEANRKQIWHAMQCALKSGNEIQCNNHTPIEDYIPQRLRWMNEWAEWYCKEQSMLYNKLVADCGDCMKKGEGGKECMNGSGECRKCKQACEEYKAKIKKWQEQWDKMQLKYLYFYHEAKTTSRHGIDAYSGAVEPKDKPVVKFLQELLPPNSDKSGVPPSTPTPYSTAAGYIHQELPNVGCMKQEVFCDNNGNKGKYVFMDPPKGYEDACGCDKNVLKPPEKKEEIKKACEIVETLIAKNNDGNTAIGGCNPKHQGGSYPVWDCTNPILVTGKGECMPPRRIKLCLYYLKELSDTTQKGLREAFIKTAASETFFAWHYYNSKNANAQEQLKAGKIPPDFLRSMFYTFGDYRDICLDTDISAKHANGDVTKAKEKIDEIFPKGKTNDTEPKEFWNKYAQNIWEAMLCALEKAGDDKVKFTDNPAYNYETVTFSGDNSHTLEEFTTRPQFLRWMTEWGEHFCREHKVEKGKLVKQCDSCGLDGTGKTCDGECGACKDQCKKYQDWLQKWQDNYKKQKQRYTQVKGTSPYNKDDDVTISTHAYEYLNKKLTNISCNSGISGKCDYKCMDQRSSTDGIPASLEYPPIEYKEKCTCTDKPPEPPPPYPASVLPNACEIAEEILKAESDNKYSDLCEQKFKNRKKSYPGWDCRPNTFKTDHDDGACMPPRRQKLYIHKLKELSDQKSETDLRQAFIECAAIETFFAWHKYKEEKKKKEKEQQYLVAYTSSVEENLKNELESGQIPEDFKRQMFYTYADYRDIFFGKDIGRDIDTLNHKIDTIFPKNGAHNSDEKREQWWQANGPHIWDGMLCALSYDTETRIMDQNARKNLNDPRNNNDYKTVKFTSKSGPSVDVKLDDFAKRSQYFRWLEEWGDEFCKKRKDKLENIEKECRGERGQNYCDGDGFDCTNIRPNEEGIFEDFNCRSCAKSCNSYKQWINKKKDEFHKQKEKYQKEIDNAKSNSRNAYDQNFVGKLHNDYKTIESFLEKLKGPFSDNNTGCSTIDFKNINKTFGHAEYCAPCPVFGVNCKGDYCIGAKEKDCNGKTFIGAEDIGKMEKYIKVDMLVTDNTVNKFPDDLKDACIDTGIFEGIRGNKWSCGYLCGFDVCKMNNFDEKKDDKQNILFRTLFKRWLEYFLKDYNKIKDSLNPCMHNGKRNVCINGCKEKCNCVDKWIDNKSKEWGKVRERYFKQYKIDNSEIYYDVRRFLEMMQPESEVKKVKSNFKDLEALETASGCIYTDLSKNSKEKDVVECLLNKLKKEINNCKNQSDDGTDSNCSTPLPTDTYTPESSPHEFFTPEEEEVDMAPKFCPKDIPEPEPDDDLLPGPVPEQKEDEKFPAKVPEVPKKPVPEKKVTPRRRPREITRSILPEMVSISAFPLSVGIAFAALSYFLLK
ncbi:hypothetical protein PFAG_01393, partial [Plasmodium falciparum Santa Lucia]